MYGLIGGNNMSRKLLLALLGGLAVVAGVVLLVTTLTSPPAQTPIAAPSATPGTGAVAVSTSRGSGDARNAGGGSDNGSGGGNSLTVVLTAQTAGRGTAPENNTGYTLRLTAEGGAPMPGDNDPYDLHMNRPGTATFPEITFNTLGVYHYHLWMLQGRDEGVTYDNVRYNISISVLRDETTNEWYAMISIRNAATQRKTDVPTFLIIYPEIEVTPTPTPTLEPTPTVTPSPETVSVTVRKVWNDNNNARGMRPVSLRMVLSNGMSVTLNAANGWTATIGNLPAATEGGQPIAYTWTEDEVPGYRQTDYAEADHVTTITNALWRRPTPPPDIPVPDDPTEEIEEYDTPLNIGVEINHVGDTFD